MVCFICTGATGFVGQHLVNLLARAGVELTIVTRDVAKAKSSLGKYERRGQTLKYFELPSSKSESADNFKDCFAKKDAVVNLAGAPVAGRRWSETYKEELISSRVGVTQRIVDTIKAIDKVVKFYHEIFSECSSRRSAQRFL
jgi:NAD dependent epimerase/dehydratase family enzyme